jgi:hypothetical protein
MKPSLADFFRRYLDRQTTAQLLGIGFGEPGESAIPHDTASVQPVDPQLAWKDALAVLPIFHSKVTTLVPPDWAGLVNAQAPAISLAFAAGNFPQMVRNLHPLLSRKLSLGEGEAQGPINATALLEWSEKVKEYPDKLLAAGVLRLARLFNQADQLLQAKAPAAWRSALANEQAALAWHSGELDKALAQWQAQPDSVPVLFNRGMASLFLDRPRDARVSLTSAVAGLPETTAWHHLACLYLALTA